jgi:hypothetical protein
MKIYLSILKVKELQQIAETGEIQGYYKKDTERLPVEKRQELLTKLRKNILLFLLLQARRVCDAYVFE